MGWRWNLPWLTDGSDAKAGRIQFEVMTIASENQASMLLNGSVLTSKHVCRLHGMQKEAWRTAGPSMKTMIKSLRLTNPHRNLDINMYLKHNRTHHAKRWRGVVQQ